jgi:Predicted membrane protein (DUF2231)
VFDTIFGLPVHALVVHAVVVLVPLCALGAVVAAVSRRWCERLATPLLVLLTVAVASAFVAKQSGEALRARLPDNPDITRHANFGSVTPWVVLAFWIVVVAWLAVERSRGRDEGITRVLLVLAVLAAVGATLQVVVTGHLGTTAVWSSIIDATNP